MFYPGSLYFTDSSATISGSVFGEGVLNGGAAIFALNFKTFYFNGNSIKSVQNASALFLRDAKPSARSLFSHNLFQDLQSTGDGAGLRLEEAGEVEITGNSFVRVESRGGKGGAIFSDQRNALSSTVIR